MESDVSPLGAVVARGTRIRRGRTADVGHVGHPHPPSVPGLRFLLSKYSGDVGAAGGRGGRGRHQADSRQADVSTNDARGQLVAIDGDDENALTSDRQLENIIVVFVVVVVEIAS